MGARPNWAEARAGLGGAHWGLLPACLSLPWLGRELPPAGGGFILMAALMASYDLAERRIPNQLTALTAGLGLVLGLMAGGPAGLWRALGGGAVGLAIMAGFFFLGMVGAGDVKALGALGVFLGPWGALELFVAATLAGGLLAVGWVLARRWRLLAWEPGGGGLLAASRGLELPYGLAIAAGALVQLLRGAVT